MPRKYFDRIQTIDRLIKIKAAGSPVQLAKRLGISESRLYEYLSFMKESGAPIVWCRMRRSYYYEKDGGFDFRFRGE